MIRFTILAASLALCGLASAQTQSPVIGNGGGTIDQQIIGDTTATADRTQATSNQIGNAANNNGASMANTVDTRDQNTVHSAGGAANSIGNQSDNKSSASNGNQTMGQANTGNSAIGNTTSNSGGNVLGGATSTSAGGQGGAGGTASSNGTNVGINGQQQGIDRSGNSANANTMTGGANTAAQGQTSANRNSQTTTAGNGAGASAGAGAGAGAGSGNSTANTTRVDASDRSSTTYQSKTVVWAPVIHGAAAPALAAANLVVVPGQCGPRVRVVKTPIVGKRFGIWGGQSDVEQGFDSELQSDIIPFVEVMGYLMGHQVVQYTAVIGTSSGASFSLGGFGKDGQAAQGGASASGQLQQIVAKVQVLDCVYARPSAPAIAVSPIMMPVVDRVAE